MKEGLQPILDGNGKHDGRQYRLHDHLIESAANNPYLSALERHAQNVIFLDGQYYQIVDNNYVNDHEPVRTASLGGNRAEEWWLFQLTPEEAADHIRQAYEQDFIIQEKGKLTISDLDVSNLLSYVRGDSAKRLPVTPIPKI